jgi:hypothetical protein
MDLKIYDLKEIHVFDSTADKISRIRENYLCDFHLCSSIQLKQLCIGLLVPLCLLPFGERIQIFQTSRVFNSLYHDISLEPNLDPQFCYSLKLREFISWISPMLLYAK